MASDAANNSQTEVKKEKKKKKKDKKEKEGADTTINSTMDSTMDVSKPILTILSSVSEPDPHGSALKKVARIRVDRCGSRSVQFLRA